MYDVPAPPAIALDPLPPAALDEPVAAVPAPDVPVLDPVVAVPDPVDPDPVLLVEPEPMLAFVNMKCSPPADPDDDPDVLAVEPLPEVPVVPIWPP